MTNILDHEIIRAENQQFSWVIFTPWKTFACQRCGAVETPLLIKSVIMQQNRFILQHSYCQKKLSLSENK